MWNNLTAPSYSSDDCNQFLAHVVASESCNIIQIVLILPLALYVLYHGYRRWKPRRSFRTASHSDFFTYHMTVMQLFAGVGALLAICGNHTSTPVVKQAGHYVNAPHFPGEVLIHCLTCVDRYLAVVHPIVYMKLKQSLGVRIRKVCMGIVWSVSLGYVGLTHYYYPEYPNIIFACMLVATLIIVSFCSVSVLCALIRPAPGDMDRDKMDQTKQKAFQTIIAIMLVVLTWVVGILTALSLYIMNMLDKLSLCLLFDVVFWLSVPCSLVLPLLYLQRAGKFTCSSK